MESIFLGKWILLSEESKYAKGTPPKKALYQFKEGGDGSLDVFIEWTDNDGKFFKVEYNIVPNGLRKKYENPQIADEVMSEFESDKQLNSYTYKGNKTISFASRKIDKKGVMEVIQRFYSPDGNSFDNVQYYEKEKPAPNTVYSK